MVGDIFQLPDSSWAWESFCFGKVNQEPFFQFLRGHGLCIGGMLPLGSRLVSISLPSRVRDGRTCGLGSKGQFEWTGNSSDGQSGQQRVTRKICGIQGSIWKFTNIETGEQFRIPPTTYTKDTNFPHSQRQFLFPPISSYPEPLNLVLDSERKCGNIQLHYSEQWRTAHSRGRGTHHMLTYGPSIKKAT